MLSRLRWEVAAQVTPSIHRLPGFMPMGGVTIGRHIFLKAGHSQVILEHELVHVRQYARWGIWGFLRRYLFSRAWRLTIEAEAYTVEARAYGVAWAATQLAGPLYRLGLSKVETGEAIRKAMA